jgi:archaellum biogenesis protein FlaJ (TadC family)
MKLKPKKEKEFLESHTGLALVVHIIFRYIGRPLLQNRKFKTFFQKNIYNVRYEKILKEANLKILPEEYFVSIYLILISFLSLSIILSIAFFIVGNPFFSAISFYGGIFLIAILGIFLYNYPILISKQRKEEIDAAIPYLLPYLKILSKELSLQKIVQIVEDFLIYKEIRLEFKKIKHYSNFLGYDINSSIREAMLSCPSKQLSDMMNDLVTITNSGGNIYLYLSRKLDNLNEEIEAIEKKTIDTLLIYSQIYVVLLLISPLFFAVMSSILNLIQFSSTSGGSASVGTASILIVLLFILPFLYAGFLMLVYYSKPLYSRLEAEV